MNPMMGFHAAMKAIHGARAHRDGSSPEELAAIDLNLLVAFDALARDRNVTAAAQRVGVTQSAMSHALRRLRELFADPLLVRGRAGMVLTARAEALVVPVRSGLVTLGRALAGAPRFDAATARRAFRIASPDLFDVLVIPALLERIREQAPGIDLAVVPVEPVRIPERLETGELDAVILAQTDAADSALDRSPLAAAGLVRRVLFHDEWACFLRADHPAFVSRKRKLSLQAYAALSHLMVSPAGAGDGPVDRALAQHDLTRRIALRIPHFYSALAIVARSDLVLTAPKALQRLAVRGAVASMAPPLPLAGHDVKLVWHERFTRDPGHEWLREQLSTVSQRVVGPSKGKASQPRPV